MWSRAPWPWQHAVWLRDGNRPCRCFDGAPLSCMREVSHGCKMFMVSMPVHTGMVLAVSNLTWSLSSGSRLRVMPAPQRHEVRDGALLFLLRDVGKVPGRHEGPPPNGPAVERQFEARSEEVHPQWP